MVNTPYDDVFRTIINDCTELVIPVVNEIFGEHYSGKEKIIALKNEHFMNSQDAVTKEKITDTCFVIVKNTEEKNKKYHIECQSTPDGSMLIRLFEYDSQIALDDGMVEADVLTVSFPKSAVLYLRHNKHTPNVLKVRIYTPGGSITYPIPVMKVQKYTIDDIFEKKLLFLIPFHIFSYERDFDKLEKEACRRSTLEKEYWYIRSRLDLLCMQGEISEYTKCTILDMSKKVLESIAKDYSAVREGVKSVMGGKILEYEAKDILRSGISQGKREGEISMCIRLIHDGLLSIQDAARQLDMEIDELKKHL